MLDLKTAQPGLYKLAAEVANPHKDRRVKHDWRKSVSFPEGSTFRLSFQHQRRWKHGVVEIAPERDDLFLHPSTEDQVSGIKLGYRSRVDGSFEPDKGNYQALADLLLAQLELNVPTDFDGLYTLYRKNLDSYDGCRAILKLFVQQGKLNLSDVEAAMKQVEDYTIFDAIGEPE